MTLEEYDLCNIRKMYIMNWAMQLIWLELKMHSFPFHWKNPIVTWPSLATPLSCTSSDQPCQRFTLMTFQSVSAGMFTRLIVSCKTHRHTRRPESGSILLIREWMSSAHFVYFLIQLLHVRMSAYLLLNLKLIHVFDGLEGKNQY